MKTSQLLQDRVEKILDEVSEAHKEDSRALVRKFASSDRVWVAEILAYADAMKGRKFRSAVRALKILAAGAPTPGQFMNLYVTLGLQASGAERS